MDVKEPARSAKRVALVHLDAEGIGCDLHVRSFNDRERSATYELVIANKSDVAVSCRLYGMDAGPQTREFGMLTIGKHSAGSSFFAVPLDTGDRGRIYVEVVGEGINLFAEALQPSARDRAAARWARFALAGALIATSTALGATYLLQKPTIRSLDVPASTTPGTVTATYAIGGIAKVRYVAKLSDGSVIAEGSLGAPSGSVAMTVPAAAAGHAVRVRLDASGPLGHTSRAADFSVIPDDRTETSPARIASLTARRETKSGQSTIVVSYVASGDRGTLRVVDSQGAVLGTLPFARSGTSRLPLGVVEAAGALRAQLDVERGNSHAVFATELPPDQTADALAGVAAIVNRGSGLPAVTGGRVTGGVASSGQDLFSVPGHVVAGQKFNVAIKRSLPGLRIAFKDGMEAVVDEVAVSPNAQSITFSAPASPTVETYYLAGTFDRGSSQETSVRSLRVYPR